MSVAFNCTLGLQSRVSVVKRRNLHTCTLRVRVCIYNTMPVGLYAYVHVLTSQKWAFLPNRTYLRTMGELRSMKNVQPKVCLNIHDAFKAKLLGRWSHLEHSCHSTMRHLKKSETRAGPGRVFRGVQLPAAHCNKNYFGCVMSIVSKMRFNI